MSYTKLAVKGTAIVFVISILAAFLGYLVRFALARNLTVEQFGLFYSVFAFLSLVGIFKSLGFNKSLIKFIPEFLHQKKFDFIKSSIIYVVIIQFITNTIIIIGIYLFSAYLSINFFRSDEALIVIRLMAIAFFIDSFILTIKYSFQGFKRILFFSSIDFVRMLLILIIVLIGFKLNYGLLSPVIAYILVPIILVFLFGWILLKKVFPKFFKSNFVFNKKLLKNLSSYSIFVMATGIGGIILGYTDILMLTYFSGLSAVAFYSVALPTAKVLLYFPRAFTGILIPLTSELWIQRKKDLIKAGIEDLYKYSIIAIIPIVLIMLSFAELVIILLFGKGYIAAAIPMKILSIGMIFAVLYSINGDFFAGIGKPAINTKMIYYAATFNFIGNLILIPLIGINGAAIATSASYFIMMVYGLIKIRKYIDISFPWLVWIKSAFVGIVFVLLIFYLKKLIVLNPWLEAFIVISISGIIYISLLFIAKIINKKEIKSIYKRIFSKKVEGFGENAKDI